MSTNPTLTAERLREVLDYDPDTGVFCWKVQPNRRSHQVRVGDVAGNVARGYREIRIDGTLHKAHRLAWLYVHGHWPTADLDHRNTNRADNRIANLREATSAQNRQNRSSPQTCGTSGFLGVSFHRGCGRWRSVIKVDGRQHHIGYFDTPEEASAAYLAAKRELHPFWDAA